jgi:hypothetical protein
MSRATPPSPGSPNNSAKLPHDKIAMRAYEKWCKRGKPMGNNPENDWIEAERELMNEQGRGQTTQPQTPGPQRR